tara:strand:- start:786 stop:1016 length:231 start_codon:yes stop_codon:yes gene_type:complete
MNKLRILMLEYPILSIVMILPFSVVLVFAVLDLIINVIVPFVFAVWVATWIYGAIVGSSITRPIYEPFWFVRSDRF